jgi:DNA-binding NtrC family response regulator
MPALRERTEDIPLLAQHFFQRMAVDLGRIHLTLSDRTLETLTTYSWPGNIRELKNVMERAVLLATGDTIQPRDLRLEYASEPPGESTDESRLTLRDVQRLHIQRALTIERGNVARAATRLGMSRSSLYNKISAFGIVHPNGRN